MTKMQNLREVAKFFLIVAYLRTYVCKVVLLFFYRDLLQKILIQF